MADERADDRDPAWIPLRIGAVAVLVFLVFGAVVGIWRPPGRRHDHPGVQHVSPAGETVYPVTLTYCPRGSHLIGRHTDNLGDTVVNGCR